MHGRTLLVAIGSLPLLLACGGEATGSDPGVFGAGGSAGNAAAYGGRAAQGGVAGSAGHAGSPEASGGTYSAPTCPDTPPPAPVKDCDPLGPPGQCPNGLGCYPFVEHPFGTGCGIETYGATCLPVGDGTQGATCGNGTSGCAPGYLCVIGALAGERCAKLCSLNGPNDCPAGMFCGDTDIQGYGVCN